LRLNFTTLAGEYNEPPAKNPVEKVRRGLFGRSRL